MRVVISGQMPPPVGGQNLNVKRFYDLLESEPDIQAVHWRMEFTKDVKSFRKFEIGKFIELIRVVVRLIKLRLNGRIDSIIYSTGGPHLAPIIRDIILLPVACLLSKRVWVHFQAAGIAEKLPEIHPVLRKLLLWVYSRCYGGLALSDYGKRDPLALQMKHIEKLPNGLEDGEGDRDSLSLVDESDHYEVVMLYVGHICEDKGVPPLIRAFSEVSRIHPEIKLRLAGECLTPFTKEQLEVEIASSGAAEHIEVVGLCTGDSLKAQYQAADVLVFPSVAPYESFGLVLVEAMIWELPIVASNWRAGKEVLGQPLGGICYDIGASHDKALNLALLEMMNQRSKWASWGRANRDRYENHFSLDCLRDNLIKIVNLA